MTYEEAIRRAIHWWMEAIIEGRWDNGDEATEQMHQWRKSLSAHPSLDEWILIEECIANTLRETKGDLYSDYGNEKVDAAFKECGLRFDPSVLLPQKAGTQLEERNGQWVVLAKNGYGAPWEEI